MSPGFVADEHLEEPPGKREFIIGYLISKVKKVPGSQQQQEVVPDVETALVALPGMAFGRGGS